jgi:hypothetical protein
MPNYKFECSVCGERRTEYMTFEEHDARTGKFRGAVLLTGKGSGCTKTARCRGGWFAQVFNFRYLRPMPEHYSPFLDAHVTSRKHYDDLSKLQQDEMSQRMGFDVSYDEIDPTDAKAAGVVGDAGLESQEEARWGNAGDVLDAEDAALFDS